MGIPAGTLEIQLITDLAKLQTQMREVKRAVGDMTDGVGRSVGAANDNFGKFGKAAESAGGSARLSGHHMQNLAFQFQDLGVQMVQAAQSKDPLKLAFTALMQQGSQISGIMSQAGIGVRGLIGALGAMLAPFAPVIVAVAALGAGFALLTGEINKNSKVHVTWKDTVLGAFDAARAFLTGALTDAFKAFGLSTEDVWGRVVNAAKWALNWIIGAMTFAPRALIASWSIIPGAIADIFLSATNGAIRTMNGLIAKAVALINGFITEANRVLDKAGLGLPTISAPQIAELSNSYAGAGAKLGNAVAGAFKDSFSRDFLGEAASYLRPFAEARARQRMAEDAKKAGGKSGHEAGKAFSDTFLEELDKMRADTLAALDKMFGGDVFKRLGIDVKAQMEAVRDDLARAGAERVKPLEDAARANAEWNAQLDGSIERLTHIGGMGAGIAGWMKALRGDVSGLSGAQGEAIKSVLAIPAGTAADGAGGRMAVTLGDRLEKIFEEKGAFGKTMRTLLQGAGTGLALGSALYGVENKAAQVGGAIGGAIGAAAGKAIGGPMGEAVGSVIGSLWGSTIGNLVGTKPRGSGTVSNAGNTASANNGTVRSNLDSFGLGLNQSVSQIAAKLGGTVGNYSVGIGQYKDYFQVASTASDSLLGTNKWGRSANKAYDGKDPEAAMRAAISVAIEQGAIQGVRAGVNALLKAGSDIEQQLAKALKFQSVFDDLKQATDPVGYALDQVSKKFTELRAIFDEAGASAADYADLEKLLSMQRADALEQGRRDMVSKLADPINLQIRLLELLGKNEDALAASRLLELAGIKQSLQPMQAMIYTLEDAAATIAKFQPLVDQMKAARASVIGANAPGSYAAITAQFRSTAAQAGAGDAAAMAGLSQAATDYLAAAKDNASSSTDYQRAVSEVLAGLDKGIFAGESIVDYQQAQIDAAKANGQLIAELTSNLNAIGANLTGESTAMRKLIDQLVNDGFQVTIPVEVTNP